MLALRVEKRLAEDAKYWLRQQNLLTPHLNATRDDDFVFFPVVKKSKLPFDATFIQKSFKASPHIRPFREVLDEILPEKKAMEAVASYDTLGKMAIIEIPKELKSKGRAIATALLQSNPHIKTVLKKSSAMKGTFRVRDFTYLAGKRNFVTEYKESGCVLRFDVRKTYFSPRLSFERHRIAKIVKKGEQVLALFAGVGPYALVIAKKQPSAEVVAIELNPDAVTFMRQNIEINKTKNVVAIRGDVRKVLKKYPKWADRACMPLPHTGEEFLEDVLDAIKDSGIVHFYGFGGDQEGVFTKALASIKKACRAKGVTFRVMEKRIVRPYAPYVFQVVIDFQVRRKETHNKFKQRKK